ncbi:MAG: phosphoenolpyruvate-utilizing N-terminal domain-containing protein, partial [Burkholderiales bacterium]
MALWLSGIGVSRGIVIGRVHKMAGGDLDIPELTLEAAQVEAEIVRFGKALGQAREQLREVRAQIPANTPGDIAAFIDTHLLMMQDSALSEVVIKLIRERNCNAEWALKLQRDNLVAVFDQMDDAYLKTRRDDVEHVTQRILRVLLKQDRPLTAPKKREAEPAVLVADDVTPADIILLHRQGVAAFITEFGGPLSHTAILARSLGIPAIVGLHHARRLLSDDEPIIVDGEKGQALAAPDAAALSFYRERQAQQRRDRESLTALKHERAVSRDGCKITLLANIELPADSKEAAEVGAEGVGLYRTEFLYMNRKEMPGEEEQYQAYCQVVRAVRGPVTVRTLDLG